MTSTLSRKAELETRARELAAREILTETNEGTYSATEAQRATGTGQPEYNTYRIFTRVGGGYRHEGCSKSKAPGRARYLGGNDLSAAQKELAALRAQIKASK